MLISQGVFTNLQVVGKQRAEGARNLSAKWSQMRRRRKRKRKTLSSHLLKQSVEMPSPRRTSPARDSMEDLVFN